MPPLDAAKPATARTVNGLQDGVTLAGGDVQHITQNALVSQAKIDLLVDDLVDTAGWLVSQLNCLPAQRDAADIAGLIYTARRSRAYWKHIAETARELVLVNDARLSSIRQEGVGL